MKKRDYLLIGAVILIAVLLSGILWMTAQKGQKVVVTVEGEACGQSRLGMAIVCAFRMEKQGWSGPAVRISCASIKRPYRKPEKVSSVFHTG